MDDLSASSTRPRRSARTPAKPPAKAPAAAAPPPESPTRPKQKGRETVPKSSAEKLENLLTNSKSKLTRVEVTEVINYPSFLDLPEEVQNRLCALLPSTAFSTFTPSVCPTHPDYDATGDGDRMQVDYAPDNRTPATLDPSVFTSPFFLSAAHTFQDHLFSSWMGKKAADDLAKFEEGARSGAMHVDWKDEVWEREHQRPFVNPKGKQPQSADMATLAKGGLLQAGDIFAYKRCFPTLNITVEKDVLVESVDPQNNSLVFLVAPGEQKALPRDLLLHDAGQCSEKVLTIQDVANPVALERGILDVDGRVRSAEKYAQDAADCAGPPTSASGAASDELRAVIAVRAWKAFTVWRWREEVREQTELQRVKERGGRERVATLFYLRGCQMSGS